MNYEHKYHKYKAKYLRAQQTGGGFNHMGGALSLQESIDAVKHINNIINNVFDDSQKEQVASEMKGLGEKLKKAKDLKWRLVGKALGYYSDMFKSMGLPSVVKQYAQAYMPKKAPAQSETSSIMLTAQPTDTATSPLMPESVGMNGGAGGMNLDPNQFKQQLVNFLELIKNGLVGEQQFAELVQNIMAKKKQLEGNVSKILQNPLARDFGKKEIGEDLQYLGKEASDSIGQVLTGLKSLGHKAQESLSSVNIGELGHRAQESVQQSVQRLREQLKQSPALSETQATPRF
jgi:hypothetical protein